MEQISVPISFRDGEDPNQHCYDLRVEFLLKQDMPWAKKGYVQMSELIPLWGAAETKPLWTVEENSPAITQTGGSGFITLEGSDWAVTFDNLRGTIKTLKYSG